AALQGLRGLVERIQRQSRIELSLERPRICGEADPTRVALGELRLRGHPAVQGFARSLLGQLENFCRPFLDWEDPRERQIAQMTRLQGRLVRVRTWLREVARCLDPGPYDRRCENAYGRRAPEAEAEVERAERRVEQIERSLQGAPETARFPCGDPLWSELAESSWGISMLRAQIPSIGRAALNVCRSIGLEPALLERGRAQLEAGADHAYGSLLQMLRGWEQAVEQLEELLR
ncbi:MAG: hypothetical protein OEY14_09770, partial [Myxococcales bacterium]|nr:hypothetical protein [Myxococcales bacterium]